MFQLTFEQRIYILCASGGVLLATVIIMACKLIPWCWLYKYCPVHSKDEEAKYTDAIYPERPLILPTLKTTPAPRSRNGSGSVVMSDLDGILTPNGAPMHILEYGSGGSTKSSSGRKHRPSVLTLSATSVSESSSKEGSPANANKSEMSFRMPNGNTSDTQQGILHLKLQYIRPDEKLTLLLESIDQFPPSFYGTANDCFVQILVIRDARRRWRRKSTMSLEEIHSDVGYEISELRSRTVRRSLNPKFDEKFAIELLDKDRKYTQIKMIAYALHRGGTPLVVGETHFWLSKLQLHRVAHTAEEWHDMKLQLTSVKQNLGELFLAIAYLPTAQRLAITNLKAVNLKAPKGCTEINPYVKAALLMRGKSIEKHKTVVHNSENNPNFTETIMFDLPASELDKVTLLISVVHHETTLDTDSTGQSCESESYRRNGSLQRDEASPQINSRSRRRSIGNMELSGSKYSTDNGTNLNKARSTNSINNKHVVVGRIAFNGLVNGSARTHWNESVLNPRKQIAQWHKLQSP